MATKKAVKKTVQAVKMATKTVGKQTKAAAKTIKKQLFLQVKLLSNLWRKQASKSPTNAYNSFKERGWRGFTSAVGNAKALYESATGKDAITGRKLSKAERAISAAVVLGGQPSKD